MIEIITIFGYVGYLILFINLILFLKSSSKQGKAYTLFTAYLGMIFVIQVLAELLLNLHYQNLFTTHLYFIGQLVLLSFFYLSILKEDYQRKIVKFGLVLGLIIIGIQYLNDSSLLFKFNLTEIFITSFLLIIYATFHFYNMLNEKKEFYYVNMGILMYLFGSSILYLVGNLTASLSPKMSLITWILNAFLYIIFQVFILVEWKKSFSNKACQY